MHVAQKWIREYQGLQILKDFLTNSLTVGSLLGNFVGSVLVKDTSFNHARAARVMLLYNHIIAPTLMVFLAMKMGPLVVFQDFFGDEIQFYIEIISYKKPL